MCKIQNGLCENTVNTLSEDILSKTIQKSIKKDFIALYNSHPQQIGVGDKKALPLVLTIMRVNSILVMRQREDISGELSKHQ